VCYICDEERVIFSGDTLFCCSVGRTDFPGSDPHYMMQSLEMLYELEGNYRIYPGHNEFTDLDYERRNNPYMKPFRG
jgi:glyoxylase-like metal-dependent hydrolase (beta-lactamase superfamily II)